MTLRLCASVYLVLVSAAVPLRAVNPPHTEADGRNVAVRTTSDVQEPHDLRQDLGLRRGNRCVVGKRYPQRPSFRVRLLTRHQRTAARNVHGMAYLGFLAERRRPAESSGKPELDAVMRAPVHKRLQ